MDVEYGIWESNTDPMQKGHVHMKKSSIHNLHHGNLNISGPYHGIGPIVMSATMLI